MDKRDVALVGGGVAIIWLLLRKKPAAGGGVTLHFIPDAYGRTPYDIKDMAGNYVLPFDGTARDAILASGEYTVDIGLSLPS